MKAIKSKVTKGLMIGSIVPTCDNSGAKIVKVVSVLGSKTRKGRVPSCGVSSLVQVAVKSGKPEMRKQVVYGVVVRQKKEYQRPNGMRVCFEDNAIVVLKDLKGNPKGTTIKGAVAKEVAERWPAVAKLASIVQ